MLIQPKYLKLWELLTSRLFRIPPYQRAYSWEEKQRKDLFEDIERLGSSGDDTTHFLATMVGLNRGKKTIVTNEFQEVEVVDGQQRLTTLILIAKALSKALDDKKKHERKLAAEIDELLIKDDKLSLLLLQTNHDSSNYFADYIRNGVYPDPDSAETLADRLLLEAMRDCEEFAGRWGDRRLVLGAILKNRLTVIFHEIDDELAVYTVFEVLNSRGLDVAWLDRLKSILMGIAFETSKGIKKEAIDELHLIWGKIYGIVGLHQGRTAEALRFAATLKSEESLSKVLSQEDAVDALRSRAHSAKEATLVSNWILEVVRAVDKFWEDPRRTAITKIAHARLLATAIELRSDLKGSEKRELLAAWERVTFRIFGMCRKDARTRVGDYVRLSRRIAHEGIPVKRALASIEALGGDEHDIETAIAELRNENCYEGWEEELRYFMFRYEEELARRAGQKFNNAQWDKIWLRTPSQSIEHICPQSKGSEVRTKDPKTIFVHRLGNLVLLPPRLNSKLRDKDPSAKADDYVKTGLLIATELKPAVKKWSVDAVRKREEALLKWARQEWA